ncbi:PAS domain S-box protein [Sulfurimonas sp.]|nr:PAS domain S-box protein [Sulfurimonas sp.]
MDKTAKVDIKSFNNPDEVRIFPNGRLELINVAGSEIGRAIFEPGWIWSKSVQPLVQTCSCEAPHFQYHLSGQLAFKMDDGKEYICKPGDVSWFPSGHDAWVVGDETVEVVDFNGMSDYANELKVLVKEHAEQIRTSEEQRKLILSSVNDGIVGLDNDGKITFINPAAHSMLGYTEKEMIGKEMHLYLHQKYPDGIVLPMEECSMYKTSKDGISRTVDNELLWCKDGSTITVEYSTTPIIQNQILSGVVVVYRDITDRKKAEKISQQQQHEIDQQKQFVQTLLDSQEQLIITTDGETLVTANETFYDFFAIDSIEDFIKEYESKCICETFNVNAPEEYLQVKMGENGRESWIDYVISRSYGHTHKAMISMGSSDFIFSVTAAKLPGEEGLKSAVFTNITEMEKAKQEIEAVNKHTRESIEYASLIQGALIPDNNVFKHYFADYFTIWQPKDIVGGDIYLFEELRDKDECLLLVIDCTGHGVPGAFVTMLVKAIERQVISKIENDENIDVSPAWILSYFNRTMKKLLQQETEESVSNAGFDGGIIYYNKKENIIKFAGAETALFYIEDEELKTIKGNRHSIGYKKSDGNYEFKEHIIEVKEGMKFYCTTDGYLDQNGGEKGFPMGKKRFASLIIENQHETFAKQQELLLYKLQEYQVNEETNDDVTVIGFKI